MPSPGREWRLSRPKPRRVSATSGPPKASSHSPRAATLCIAPPPREPSPESAAPPSSRRPTHCRARNPNTARAAWASRAVHRSLVELKAWARSAAPPDLAAALELLGRRDRTDAWPVLCEGLRHPAADVRAAAASALGWLELPGATPTLLAALSDKEPFVVVAVCAALARCADARAVLPLRRMASGNETVNRAARRALQAGRHLRAWPPDERIRLRALAPAPLPLTVAGRLTTALQGPDLRCRVSAAGVNGEAQIAPDDIPGLLRITAMLERAGSGPRPSMERARRSACSPAPWAAMDRVSSTRTRDSSCRMV